MFVSIRTDESLFRRTEVNQHLHSSRVPRARFWKPRSCPWKARSAHLRDPYPPLVQIRSRDQSPRRNSGIESTVNNSSIALSCISLSLSLSLSLSIFFFFLAQRGVLVDAVLTRQPRSVRQFTPWPFCLPRSFFFLSFPFFFLVRHRKREHKPPGDEIQAGKGGTKPFSNLSCVAEMCTGISENLMTAFYYFKIDKRKSYKVIND